MAASALALPVGLAAAAARPRATRRAGWWVVLLVVLVGHALATLWLRDILIGWGYGDQPMPARMEVAFVQTLEAAAPPAAAPARPVGKAARAHAAPPAASAPVAQKSQTPAPEPEPLPEPRVVTDAAVVPVSVAPPADDATAVAAAASAAAAVVAAASAPPAAGKPFEWPPSTRLSYALTGNYRGEVNGNARVQWVRQGSRYQVHLDVAIGPSFAPLISRRMTSDGTLGERGLVPRRYDEATRVLFRQPGRATVLFSPEQVTLANGSQHEALPDVQDTASQFVQLTWLFTTQPELLRAGNTVTMALALPKRTDRWVYDVLGVEQLVTPIGVIDAYHLKPRLGERRPGNELSAEVWFAPTLQYLPVRLRIAQDADTFIDLLLDSAPLQAAPEAAASAPR
jgi:hypothetical protein